MHMALLRSNTSKVLTIIFIHLFFYNDYNNTIYLILSYLINDSQKG